MLSYFLVTFGVLGRLFFQKCMASGNDYILGGDSVYFIFWIGTTIKTKSKGLYSQPNFTLLKRNSTHRQRKYILCKFQLIISSTKSTHSKETENRKGPIIEGQRVKINLKIHLGDLIAQYTKWNLRN